MAPDKKVQLDSDFSIAHRVTQYPYYVNTSHMHDQLEVMLVIQGNPTVTVNGHTFHAPDGSLLLFNQMDMHTIIPQGEVFNRYVLYFRMSFLDMLSSESTRLLECFYLRSTENPGCITLSPEERQSMTELLDRVQMCSRAEETFGKELEQRYLMGLVLIHINRLAARNTTLPPLRRQKNAQMICDIMRYIQQNIDGDLSLQKLAAVHYIDKNRLCRIFSESLGVSPRQYVIKARIASAQQMLLQGESIDRVCGRCGFNSLAHFSRTFRAHIGVPPSRFAAQAEKKQKQLTFNLYGVTISRKNKLEEGNNEKCKKSSHRIGFGHGIDADRLFHRFGRHW